MRAGYTHIGRSAFPVVVLSDLVNYAFIGYLNGQWIEWAKTTPDQAWWLLREVAQGSIGSDAGGGAGGGTDGGGGGESRPGSKSGTRSGGGNPGNPPTSLSPAELLMRFRNAAPPGWQQNQLGTCTVQAGAHYAAEVWEEESDYDLEGFAELERYGQWEAEDEEERTSSSGQRSQSKTNGKEMWSPESGSHTGTYGRSDGDSPVGKGTGEGLGGGMMEGKEWSDWGAEGGQWREAREGGKVDAPRLGY